MTRTVLWAATHGVLPAARTWHGVMAPTAPPLDELEPLEFPELEVDAPELELLGPLPPELLLPEPLLPEPLLPEPLLPEPLLPEPLLLEPPPEPLVERPPEPLLEPLALPPDEVPASGPSEYDPHATAATGSRTAARFVFM